MGQSLAIPRVIPNDWKRLDLIINKIKMRLGRDGTPTFTDLTLTGVLTLSTICTVAAGLNVLRVTGLQTDAIALTGTLRGGYIDVSNGALDATGTIRALELKARTEAPGDTGNDIAVLEGLSISADSKGHGVTTMRAAEFILDGSLGGTIDEAVGLRIANNLQADKATLSYGLQIYRDSFDYTYDISLSLGGHITGDSYATQDYRVTASPTFAGLHINSAEVDSTTLLTLESDINNNNEYNEILFKVVGGQNYGAIRSCVGAIGGDSYMSFFTTTNGGTLVRQVTIQHNGKVGFGTYNPETVLTIVNAAPYLTLYNITEEDTDGGGESRLIYKREDGAGTGTACFQFEASHDGSGANDQLGKGVWSVNTGAGLVEGMRLDSSLTATFAGVVQATDFAKTGWPIVTGATFSFDNTTKVFTVTDGGSAYYYIGGVKYILGGNKTVDLDDIGIAEGLWHIYFDGATLTASQAVWSFRDEDKALVAILYWDNTNNKEIFLGWEAHTFHMSGSTHARLHYAGGARWEIGLLVSDAGSEHVNVSAGDIWDEDLNIPITDEGGGLFSQVLSPAQLPIYYRDGASAWRKHEIGDKAAVTDVGYLSGGDLKWNDATTTWSNETVGLNNYVAYYVVATNEQTEPIALIMGQRVDNKFTEAKVNNVFAGLSLAGLPFEEMVVLARLILKDTGTYTLEEVLDLRAYNVKGNITSPLISQHAGLGGLNWSSSGHYFDAAVDFNTQNISNIGTVGCGVITQSGATLAATYQPLHANLTSLATLTYAAAAFVKMTGANTFVLRTIGETADDLQGTIDHDLTANYVADKHVAHAGVSITAGKGLSGGGTIAATRDLALDLTEMTGNVVWDDGATDASITWTYALSGANDPVWTIGANSMDLTTGVLKVGGTTVMLVGGAPTAHLHDGDVLECDGINSSAGAFPFDTGGLVTFNEAITMSAGKDLTIAGHIIFNTNNSYIGFTNPRITFNDTSDRLDITGGIIGSSTAIFEGASVTVGKASTTTGTLVLHDSNSANTITLTVPNISAGSLSFTLPPTDGDNTNVLQTDGNGVLTWTTAEATSHADVVVDGDFGSNGILNRTGAGAYSILALGTDVQAYHANLAAIAAGTWTGAASITTLGTIATVGNITIANNGTIGQAAGPLLTFDDTNNFLEILGCHVGVGTSTPRLGGYGTALTVSAGVTGDVIGNLELQGARTTNTTFASILYFHKANMVGEMSVYRDGADDAGAFSFGTRQTGTGSPSIRLFINSIGNVGIGTAVPDVKLEINTASAASVVNTLKLVNPNTDTGGVRILLGQEIGNDWYMASIETAGRPISRWGSDLWLRTQGVSHVFNNGIFLNTDGNTGFGMITPYTRVTIEGTITLKEQAAADGDTAAYGQIWVDNSAPCRLRFTNDVGGDFYAVVSDAGTGGADSAGAGKQYVEMEIAGSVYKVLHDGTV